MINLHFLAVFLSCCTTLFHARYSVDLQISAPFFFFLRVINQNYTVLRISVREIMSELEHSRVKVI